MTNIKRVAWTSIWDPIFALIDCWTPSNLIGNPLRLPSNKLEILSTISKSPIVHPVNSWLKILSTEIWNSSKLSIVGNSKIGFEYGVIVCGEEDVPIPIMLVIIPTQFPIDNQTSLQQLEL